MTTQAIIETIPKEATQSSDISDHELKESLSTNTTPPEALLVPESEPETEGEPSSDVTLVEVKEEEHEEDQELEESDCKYSINTNTSLVGTHSTETLVYLQICLCVHLYSNLIIFKKAFSTELQ